ncbi:MAG: glycine cleavage system protein GcvH [Saprospirales bacterium]|nr:glycine cleavage system protein GcvH [Saprospirales bacterium]
MAHEKINGCVVIKDLYYSVNDHTWIRLNDDGTVTVGMTDVAQTLAGPILHAKAKNVGAVREKGKPIAIVESGKWVGPIKSPVTGEIIEVNERVAADAQLLNRSPYRDGWVLKMKPSNLGADIADMVTGDAAVEAYRAKISADNLKACTHIEGTDEYE